MCVFGVLVGVDAGGRLLIEHDLNILIITTKGHELPLTGGQMCLRLSVSNRNIPRIMCITITDHCAC